MDLHPSVGQKKNHWMREAACLDVHVRNFFPTGGPGVDVLAEERSAIEICGRCPVWRECLGWAYQMQAQVGVFGRLAARERSARTLDEAVELAEGRQGYRGDPSGEPRP